MRRAIKFYRHNQSTKTYPSLPSTTNFTTNCFPSQTLSRTGSNGVSDSLLLGDQISLLQDGQLHSLALGQSDLRGLSRSNDEHVLLASGEGVARGVLDGHDVEGARVVLYVLHGAHTTGVASLGDDGQLASLEVDVVQDLASLDLHLDHVVHTDGGIGVSNGATVVSDHVGDLLLGQLQLLDASQLELLLLIGDAVQDVAALGVKDQTELVSGLGDLNHVHETSREVGVGAHLAVNLHVLLHADDLGLLAGEGVLESVPQDQDQGQTLPQLVGALGGSGCL